MTSPSAGSPSPVPWARTARRHWQLYLLLIPPLLYVTIFLYLPMYGVQIAFKDFSVSKGITGSSWVGFGHFRQFLTSYFFSRVFWNTIRISLYNLLAGFPAPILLALALNEVASTRFRRTVQLLTYAPHFVSTVVIVSIMMQMLSPTLGVVSRVVTALGGRPVNLMADPRAFLHIYTWSGVWQDVGYGAIIYLAALAGVDPQLYEAATVDGASKLQKIYHIDIPGILPTATVLLILRVGRVMTVGFEKIFLMQNPLNLRASEIIATYVYKVGLVQANYSFAAAVGLFNNLINFVLLVAVNRIARRLGETSLW